MDFVFETERDLTGLSAEARQRHVAPMINDLHDWMRSERALRGIALGRKAWLPASLPRGGERAAFMYALIVTANMNDVDP